MGVPPEQITIVQTDLPQNVQPAIDRLFDFQQAFLSHGIDQASVAQKIRLSKKGWKIKKGKGSVRKGVAFACFRWQGCRHREMVWGWSSGSFAISRIMLIFVFRVGVWHSPTDLAQRDRNKKAYKIWARSLH